MYRAAESPWEDRASTATDDGNLCLVTTCDHIRGRRYEGKARSLCHLDIYSRDMMSAGSKFQFLVVVLGNNMELLSQCSP